MNSTMIKVDCVGKIYRRGLRRDMGATLYNMSKRAARRMLGRVSKVDALERQSFGALQDVSFEVGQGECFGIVGRNGSGKSTLLKLICGVSRPTTGRIVLYGRPTLLAAMGVGMSGELTGRENIFINGGILGASEAEIRKLFDEIVAFAELERFLDTPVKFYSTGMYARLAFSVASHMPGEILLLDEVLVVGDQGFQQKCRERLKHLTANGDKTVMLVAHSSVFIRQLCQRCLFLDKGKAIALGESAEVVRRYEEFLAGAGIPREAKPLTPQEDVKKKVFKQEVRLPEYQNEAKYDGSIGVIERVAILNDKDGIENTFTVYEKFKILIDYALYEPLHAARVVIGFMRNDGVFVHETADHFKDRDIFQYREAGKYRAEIKCLPCLLGPGIYKIMIKIVRYDTQEIIAENASVSLILTNHNRLDSPFEPEHGRAASEFFLDWETHRHE